MKSHVENRYLVGFLFLVAGLALLFNYYDILPWALPNWVFSWKTLLVFLGVIFMASRRNKTTGLVLFTIGAVFLAGDIFNVGLREVIRIVIPVALIIAGLAIIMKRQSFTPKQINIPEGADVNDYLNDTNIFGGGERKIKTQNFKGGQLTAIFGGSEIDLRHSDMAPGVNAIDMLCIFGGTSLKIPSDWEVKNEVTAIFGGFSDERTLEKSDPNEQPGKILYLKGLVLFGGGEIKS